MNPVLLAQLINTLGTVGLPLIIKIKADIDAGRLATTVTDADLHELDRLSKLTAEDIYKSVGVTPPPSAS